VDEKSGFDRSDDAAGAAVITNKRQTPKARRSHRRIATGFYSKPVELAAVARAVPGSGAIS
jgi:hypothetical protein